MTNHDTPMVSGHPAGTRSNAPRLAVIGSPIGHSPSPAMHNAALVAHGLPASYERWRVVPDALDGFVARLRVELTGCNVTIPHKIAIMPHIDSLDDTALRTGAVNTVVRRGSELRGHNTDVEGFAAALRAAGCDPAGRRVVVFGAGGAARAVLQVVAGYAERLTIAARDPRKAAELAATSGAGVVALDGGELRDEVAAADLLVNATPLGMGHLADRCPLPAAVTLNPAALAIDLVYGRETPFLTETRAQGLRACDGLEMLVRQGAASFRLWLGIEPDVDIMRDACRTWLFPGSRAASSGEAPKLNTESTAPC